MERVVFGGGWRIRDERAGMGFFALRFVGAEAELDGEGRGRVVVTVDEAELVVLMVVGFGSAGWDEWEAAAR
jgi:hypothetical protein